MKAKKSFRQTLDERLDYFFRKLEQLRTSLRPKFQVIKEAIQGVVIDAFLWGVLGTIFGAIVGYLLPILSVSFGASIGCVVGIIYALYLMITKIKEEFEKLKLNKKNSD